jgi:hypothetical protein
MESKRILALCVLVGCAGDPRPGAIPPPTPAPHTDKAAPDHRPPSAPLDRLTVTVKPFTQGEPNVIVQVPQTAQSLRFVPPSNLPGYHSAAPAIVPAEYLLALNDAEMLSAKTPAELAGRILSGPLELQYEIDVLRPKSPGSLWGGGNRTGGVTSVPSFLTVMPGNLGRPLDVCLVDNQGAPLQVMASAQSGAPGCIRFDHYAEAVDTPISFGPAPPLVLGAAGEPPFVIRFAGGLTGLPEATLSTVRAVRADVLPLWQSLGVRWGALDCKDSFMVHLLFDDVGQGVGGLEHGESTLLGVGKMPSESQLRSFLTSVMLHEMVHAWNVKRVFPAELGSFDYAEFEPEPQLYFYEGFTEAYARMLMAEQGSKSPNVALLEGLWAGDFYRIGQLIGKKGKVPGDTLRSDPTMAYDYGDVLALWLAARSRQVHGLAEGKRRFESILAELVRGGGFDLARPSWAHKTFRGTGYVPAHGAPEGYTPERLAAAMAAALALPDWAAVEARFLGESAPFATAQAVEAVARDIAGIVGVKVSRQTKEGVQLLWFDLAGAPADAWPL